MVTNEDGHITQNVVYIPYGEVFVEERNGSWASPYLFNAKELDEETGLYYYGARYLDPAGARWQSVDPMWKKYMGMSPYNYCAENPVKMVDPDGRIILFAEGCSEEFKKSFAAAIKYLKANECDYAFARLNSSDEVFYISELSAKELDKTSFDTETKTIYWNPNYGVQQESGVMSPASVLNHEGTHASRYLKYLTQAKEAQKKHIMMCIIHITMGQKRLQKVLEIF